MTSNVTCYTGLAPGGSYASAEALASDCSTPETDPNYGGGYQNDPRTSTSLPFAEAQVGSSVAQDAIFADDTGTTYGLNSLPICNYAAANWITAAATLNNNVGVHFGKAIWENAIMPGIVSGATITQQAGLVNGSNIPGAMCESCFLNNSGVVTGSNWASEENMAIDVTTQYGKVFWAYLRNTATPSTANFYALRLYGYASFLLTYDPNLSMVQTAFDNSTFTIMPETALVPMSPLNTASYPSTVSSYALSGGGYMRQWGMCYYAGTPLNKCAAVINPTTSTISVPAGYGHSLLLSGSDDYTSNCPTTWPTPCVSIAGPAVTSLAPGTAAIVFP